MPTITELCNQLADAYEAKGIAVRENLRPGLTTTEILETVAPLQIIVPDDVIELYQWRNGRIDKLDSDLDTNFCFRDNEFISLEEAVLEYQSIQEYYGLHSTLEQDRVDLKACLPISEFQGSWDVVACGAHLFGSDKDHPVIRVFHGIRMYFYSISSMLETCIEWVSSPNWKDLDGLPDEEEMEIWRRHNPDIFRERF
ncbi:hypothetical protein UNDYM_4725 [Undibacterium sp. YM2]|uniref:hypothetical protein n=1 Tax=Undibacterium sp. YM2 TaxID=2058625 RepID=UPI001331F0D1|nr:hypothetical protein [Undibacterium sp. YM2]BBB68978.1 hypothetical protein UNDYM_4725 [Undibacterium sp. YM2]